MNNLGHINTQMLNQSLNFIREIKTMSCKYYADRDKFGENDCVMACRVCLALNEENMINLLSIDKRSHDLFLKIQKCADVKIDKNDNLPTHICAVCTELLDCAAVFKEICEKSETQLMFKKTIKVQDGEQKMETDIPQETIVRPNVKCENSDDEDSSDNVEVSAQDKSVDNIEDSTVINNEFYDMKFKSQLKRMDHHLEEKHSKKVSELKSNLFVCEVCGGKYSQERTLRNHMITRHDKPKKYPCNVCGDKLTTRKEQTMHWKMHCNGKPYMCESCGKAFTQKIVLKNHMLIHTNELPYACPHCPYRARLKISMTTHERVHSGERPYACQLCPAAFINPSNLNRHLRTHTQIQPYKCDICNRTFCNKAFMADHKIAVHDGIKNFACDVCDKLFSYRKTLYKHRVKVHKIRSEYRSRPATYLLDQKKNGEHEVNEIK